ncbi:MAG: hypothetical protein JNM56_28465 [Planctomycetia bacterium]|nr:hypothetical protein [Planctomycetia bacterium]
MSTSPVPPKADNTALYIVLGVCGGFLLLCIAPAIIIVVCLAAIQVLGKNASTTFQTVGQSLSTTAPPGRGELPRLDVRDSADEFIGFMLEAKYDLAFARMTPEYRQRNTPQTLRQLWDGNAVLRRRDNLSHELIRAGEWTTTQRSFAVIWKDGDRQAAMVLVFIRSATGDWEVSHCSVQ